MRLLVVNPNTTASMTETIGAAARSVAAPGTEIVARNPEFGPVSVEGYYDEAFCVPGLIAEVKRGAAEGVDGTIVACFDDPGIDAARTVATGPLIGICEAALKTASLIAERFSVVTTLPRAVPTIERLAQRYGVAQQCRIRAADIPVLSLEDPNSGAGQRIRAEISAALDEDDAQAVVLGCAGMADLTAALTREFGVPVIDGVASAVKLIEGLVSLGLKPARTGAYAPPEPKPFTGRFADFAPN